jgi:hypothetical protein
MVIVVSLLDLGLHHGSLFSLDLVLSWVGVVVVTLYLLT